MLSAVTMSFIEGIKTVTIESTRRYYIDSCRHTVDDVGAVGVAEGISVDLDSLLDQKILCPQGIEVGSGLDAQLKYAHGSIWEIRYNEALCKGGYSTIIQELGPEG